jgi:hypothetical protein
LCLSFLFVLVKNNDNCFSFREDKLYLFLSKVQLCVFVV